MGEPADGVAALLPSARARDCVLQDHLKGRYSEVDSINSLVAEERRRFGKMAPANGAVVEVTRRIHAGELKPRVSNLAIARDLLRAAALPASN